MLGYNRGLDDAGVEPNDERRKLVEVPSLASSEDEPLEPIIEMTEAATMSTPSEDPTQSPPLAPPET